MYQGSQQMDKWRQDVYESEKGHNSRGAPQWDSRADRQRPYEGSGQDMEMQNYQSHDSRNWPQRHEMYDDGREMRYKGGDVDQDFRDQGDLTDRYGGNGGRMRREEDDRDYLIPIGDNGQRARYVGRSHTQDIDHDGYFTRNDDYHEYPNHFDNKQTDVDYYNEHEAHGQFGESRFVQGIDNLGYHRDEEDYRANPRIHGEKHFAASPDGHNHYSGGQVNTAFSPAEDDNDSLINVHNKHRSFRHGHHRRSRRSGVGHHDNRRSYVDEVKTLAWRRKATLSRARAPRPPLSQIGSTLHHGERVGSEFYETDGEDDNKLPSNRTTKTKALKVRLEILKASQETTAHDMAGFLRDQILTKEPSKLQNLDKWKYKTSLLWGDFKSWFNNMVYQLELWSGAFKVIEGHFGTSTMLYFRFMRWLMFLNIFMTIFMLSIVVLPFVLITPGQQSDFNSTTNMCESMFHYESVMLSYQYKDNMTRLRKNESVAQEVIDVLQGTGWLETTELFYGAYHNKTVNVLDSNYTYNMGLAYLIAIAMGFLLSFVLLVKNSAKGFKQSLVLSSGGAVTLYCNKVFGAWDYCIAEQKTAILKHKNILQGLKNELEYQRLQWKKDKRTKLERFKLYSARLLINLFVISLLGASLYLIYFTNEKLLNLVQQESKSGNEVVLLLAQYLPSVTITLLNVIVPIILNKVVIAEDYMPAFTVKITLTRTVLLRLASLGVMMISLYKLLNETKVDTEETTLMIGCSGVTTPTPPTVSTNQSSTTTNETNTNTGQQQIHCWETYVGQQIYKLIMLNFIVVIVSTFVWEFPRKFVYSKLHKKLKLVALLGQQEFDLSKSILDLVYLQTLCWLGMFFSPIAPAICAITCFVFFYVKKLTLMHNYLPTQKYGLSRSNSLFMLVLLLSFSLAATPIIYMIGSMPPSKECGPFRVYSSRGYIMFSVISNLAYSWIEGKDFIKLLGNSGFLVVPAICLCFLMYYFYIVGQAEYTMAKALKEQLKIEGQDKQFLLARVNEVLGLIEEHERKEEEEEEGED